jgi:hypothetical protein
LSKYLKTNIRICSEINNGHADCTVVHKNNSVDKEAGALNSNG